PSKESFVFCFCFILQTTMEDEFDQIINVEQDTYEDAKSQGVVDGQKLGYVEGYQLGFQQGTELGQEVGYYHSCVTMWNNLRGLASLEKLTKMIEQYQLDFNDDDVMNTLAQIRLKFKLTSAQLGLQTREQQEMSF
ncbi:hypothetical protein SAMD00019534_101430, partial [Acytostelium subglobosum LB1]|uniref:hypothetical protein n=1 Tax=Acytostelium subglobosum LB1 TaxID=1410327 RepID=UPI000644C335